MRSSSHHSLSRSHRSSRLRHHRSSMNNSRIGTNHHGARMSHSGIGMMSRHTSRLSHMELSSHRRMSTLRTRMKSPALNHHGISDSHAFAVGRSTGVNINGSAMGANGVALYRSSRFRKNRMNSSSTINKNNAFKLRKNVMNNKKYTSKKFYLEDSGFSNINTGALSFISIVFVIIAILSILAIFGIFFLFANIIRSQLIAL